MLNVGARPNPFANASFQTQYLRQLIENSGSDNLKRMLQQGQLNDDELVKYALAHPEELQGAGGQGQAFSMAGAGAANGTDQGAAVSFAFAMSASAPSDSYQPSEESSDSEGDPDLEPFSEDETMAAPSMCAMGGVSACDKAKPEMQQNLKECKACCKGLEQLQAQDEGGTNIAISMAITQMKEKEGIMRACLRRGKGAADDAYKSQGIDPKDESAVSSFVAKIGKEVIDLATKNGLEVEVSQKRADRLNDAGGAVKGGDQKGAQAKDKEQPAVQNNVQNKDVANKDVANKDVQNKDVKEKDAVTKDKDAKEKDGVNKDKDKGQDGEEDEFLINTAKTTKDVQLGVDEVEANPAMAGAIREQLMAQFERKEQEGDAFQPSMSLDLGETRQGSPLDQAFSAPRGGGAVSEPGSGNRGGVEGREERGGDRGGDGFMAYQAPAAPTQGVQPRATGGGGGRQGKATGSAPNDIRGLMQALGLSGQKFNAKVQVYEPNQQVTVSKPNGGGGGVKVNGNLSGKSINVKVPKLVARDAEGKLHKIGGLQNVGNQGTFMATLKGEPTGNEAAKQIHTNGDGSISIPGTKAS